ncbi:NAD(P)H-flavin reductase [Glaciecola sp. MH2013]|uniref:NAD(P)H-flavin reductase n=1 Tax=Glaciecola sp. MH2013 TaxID=2785524 RepID=UPI00189F18AE|nr:NAD(P)H-flavin reductase [Glaciecola sp. MH2013]MBF7074020.1 NAD(P)H-flavin reductase [Glaciecola sp. MH2013]
MKVVNCTVKSIESLTTIVHKVVLTPQSDITFKAGQYCQVVMGPEDKRPFSIANPSHELSYIELHIGADPVNTYAYEVLEKCRQEGELALEVALGDAFLREDEKPAIVVAGGTGYSYAKSIVYTCLHEQPKRKISLYWGAKNAQDLYEIQELTALSALHENFSFHPVIENLDSIENDTWHGHIGFVHKAVMKDYPQLTGNQVYSAGRFEMSATIRDEYLPIGLDRNDLFGDAYAFI